MKSLFTLPLQALLVALALSYQHQHAHAADPVRAGAPETLVALGGECVRLFHSTGDVGCRSLSRADMAALYPIRSEAELKDFVKRHGDGSTTPPPSNGTSATSTSKQSKRALVMPEQLLQYDVLAPAIDAISGIFVYPDREQNVSFASTTPQGKGTPDARVNPFSDVPVPWNPSGEAFLERSVPFSVVMLQNASLGETFMDRAVTNLDQGPGPTYTAFLNYYFGPPSSNSSHCLGFKNVYGDRSPKCDPIGGQNVWGSRGGRGDDRDMIMAMAALDATALSHIYAPGANTAASGVVALLAAAEALRVVPDEELAKQIVFGFFQAEKYGFVGSRAWLADVKAFTVEGSTDKACANVVETSSSPFGASFCGSPLRSNLAFTQVDPRRIAYALAVDQVGRVPASGKFTLHLNPNAKNATKTKPLVDAVTKAPAASGNRVGLGATGALPPTSLTSFVNEQEFGQKELVGAVLAGYNESYVGEGLYNSQHDQYGLVDVGKVVEAAQVMAEALYTLSAARVSSATIRSIAVNEDHVKTMMECITTSWTCEYMKDISRPMVQSMRQYLNFVDSAWPSYRQPVTLYSGPMGTDRQTLVMERENADEPFTSRVAEFTGTWSEDKHRVRLFPTAYEVFVQSFLSMSLVPNAVADKAKQCKIKADCAKGELCIAPGKCVVQRAYFHDAFSPGLRRQRIPFLFDIVNDSMPLWTESRWESDITSYVFPDPGAEIGWSAFGGGIMITVVGYVLSRKVRKGIEKLKLL